MVRTLDRRQLIAAAALSAPLIGGLAPSSSEDATTGSRLVLLGTAGGPTPKPNRSAPAQAVVVDGRTYVIDCGNGVARQMVLAGLALDTIETVLVTHHHSDHDADFGNLLLLAWAGNLATPVDCYGPPPLEEMTRLFLQMNRTDIQTRMADEGRVDLSTLIRAHDISTAGIVHQDERVTIRCCVVNHPPITPSLAWRIDAPDRSFVISGDTTPSDALVELAQGADVLVHEVMYLPALEQLIASEPNATRLREHLLASHTTTDQVGQIATRAGVKTLVLSHFVPGGYPFIADQVWLDAVRPHFDGEIIIGRDLLSI